jgi:Flp pilus assembly protein TadD
MTHRDALLAAKKPADALRALDQGMARLGPIASLQLAAIDMETSNQNWAGALERLDQLLKQAPKSEVWIVRRGEILEHLGRRDEARAEREKALQLITARPAARRNQTLTELEHRLRAELSSSSARAVASNTTPDKGDHQ